MNKPADQIPPRVRREAQAAAKVPETLPLNQMILIPLDKMAPRLGISARTLRTWINKGDAPPPAMSTKTAGGGGVRLNVQQYLEWAASGCPRPDQKTKEPTDAAE